MGFADICELDSHKRTILQLALELKKALDDERDANKTARELTFKRMEIESRLRDIVDIVVRRNDYKEDDVIGRHYSDTTECND